ncbi:HNH endonuclease [Oceanobacillus massiliensis]|uniref:HNH endonuclease n=1 Tax=Oceanobacillus massiliensis TaxID=1465765 RepID=UPI0030170A47
MDINYKNPLFYTYECRKQFEIVDKVKINTLLTLETIKPVYECHIFSDGYIGLYNGNKYLKPTIATGKDNYINYNLATVHGNVKKVYMHRLVGLWKLEGYQDGYFVDHGDNDKSNNLISNLEWISHADNTRKAVKDNCGVGRPRVPVKPKVYKTKLEVSKSANNGKNGLTYDDVTSIFDMLEDGYSMTKIAKTLGVSQPAISQIKSGKRWKEHESSIKYREKVV